MSSKEDKNPDPFDTILGLEDQFYQEGYALGVADGQHAGLIEGRAFGLEKGFEKFLAMGKAHGRAKVWAARLATASEEVPASQALGPIASAEEPAKANSSFGRAPRLLPNSRLEAHVRTLYALTEPGSLSTANTEDAVADYDDRMKRAEGKIKVIEKITGESGFLDAAATQVQSSSKQSGNVDGSIEDMSVLHARH